MNPLDFLEIILSFEFGGDVGNSVSPDLLKETAVRNFYVRCEKFTGHTCSPDSDADIFTYIERKKLLSMRPGYILQAEDDPNKNSYWNPEKLDRSKVDFSDAIRSPDPRWMRKFVDQAIEWCNLSLIKPTLQVKIINAEIGIKTDQVVQRGGKGETFFILTECQTNHWGAPPPVGYGQDEGYGTTFCGEKPGWTSH